MKIAYSAPSSTAEENICIFCSNSFTKSGQNQKYCSKDCQIKDNLEHRNTYNQTASKKDPKRYLLNVARSRAKRRGIPFDLSYDDFDIPIHCPVFGFTLEKHVGQGAGGKDDSYSLDRIDPSKGYVKDNVQVISHKANSMKHSATKEELLQFADWILKTYA